MPSKLRKPDGTFVTEADLAIGNAVQGAAVANVAGTTPAGGTGATEGAYDTAAHRDALIATVAELKAQLNALLASLRAAGLIDT